MSLFNESYDVIIILYFSIFLIFLALSPAEPLITSAFKLGVNFSTSPSQFNVKELGQTTIDGFAFLFSAFCSFIYDIITANI